MADPIRDRIRELRRVPASELRANPANWRTHPPAQQRALAAMLERIGFAGALLARETDDGLELIDGHLRAELAPDTEVPVLVLDVDAEEALLLLATLDPLAAMAGTDPDQLAGLLNEVDVDQADLARQLNTYRGRPGATLQPVDPDDVPQGVPAATAAGDVWLLGDHRVMCGDAGDPAAMDLLMAGTGADLIVTDPPYNVAYEGRTSERLTIENDALHPEDYSDLLGRTFREMYRVAAPGAVAYVFHGDGGVPAIPVGYIAAGFALKQVLIWVKGSAVLGRQDYNWQHEPIIYGWKPGAAHAWHGASVATTVIDDAVDPMQMRTDELVAALRELQATSTVLREDRPQRSAEHPTMKPVRLLERLIRNSSPPRSLVLDPFMGSGSTLIASEALGRRCYGMEIAPAYCDVIVRRWEEFTGRTAVLEGSEDEAMQAFAESH